MASPMTFGQRLRYLRVRAALYGAELARAAGISKAYVSALENEWVRPPSDAVVKRLERALGVRDGELIWLAHLDRTPDDVRDLLFELMAARDRDRVA